MDLSCRSLLLSRDSLSLLDSRVDEECLSLPRLCKALSLGGFVIVSADAVLWSARLFLGGRRGEGSTEEASWRAILSCR